VHTLSKGEVKVNRAILWLRSLATRVEDYYYWIKVSLLKRGRGSSKEEEMELQFEGKEFPNIETEEGFLEALDLLDNAIEVNGKICLKRNLPRKVRLYE